MPAHAFQPTEEQRRTVKSMAGFGIPQADIAAVIGINPETLRKHFRHELDVAMAEANARVAGSLFRLATEGENVTAAIFWLKCRAGWKEPRDTDANEPTTIRIIGGLPEQAKGEPERVEEVRVPRRVA